jgi:predicted GNAT family acetyltransferase
MSWKRAAAKDLPALKDFLMREEWRCVPFTSRFRQEDRKPFSRQSDKRIFINRDSHKVNGALMVTARGLFIPVLAEREQTLFSNLKKMSSSLYSVMGTLPDVQAVAVYFPIHPEVTVDYFLMTLSRDDYRAPCLAYPPGLETREAALKDAKHLFPLQAGYEIEEVIISPDHFHKKASFIMFKQALQKELITVAELKGRAVAKAGTNAQGFNTAQIGGVYTIKEERNKGIAFLVMSVLLERVFRKKEMASLFVKKNNPAAISLYRKLGFTLRESYRICYYNL